MQKFIVLFRGINVGGNNLLPMKEFVTLLKQNNYQDVSSYIQSGNVVLKSTDDPRADIQQLVAHHYDFKPNVFTLTESAFSSAVINNPFDKYEGKFVHFYFCQNPIKLNNEKLTQYISSSEQYLVHGNVFYLHAPDGIGRSKLVSNIETCLGQSATGRNLNTIGKIIVM